MEVLLMGIIETLSHLQISCVTKYLGSVSSGSLKLFLGFLLLLGLPSKIDSTGI